MSVTSRTQDVSSGGGTKDIKQVPQQADTRAAIRDAARDISASLERVESLSREDLEAAGIAVVERLSLPHNFLGFAMVAVDNAFWLDEFAAVPTARRLLLLPKCLSDPTACKGDYDTVGLNCAECGACAIVGLKQQAQNAGYEVVVAEGTSSVIMKVLEGKADAVLGVACLDSLEKSFERIADLGIPHHAIPLLTDGCCQTSAELDLIREMIPTAGNGGGRLRQTYLPLLRETRGIFDDGQLDELLRPCVCASLADAAAPGPAPSTDELAREWLRRGGKRLRPFITVAAYAVGRHGATALGRDVDLSTLVPDSVRRIAVAIETVHKASLVHDDIEDHDPERYGQPTIHRAHGTPTAINVGDYLLGLGYRLIAGQAAELGAECVTDILARLSEAHVQLCCGQGTELSWHGADGDGLRPIHALQIGAMKTAPAFEVALYAGLRAAGAQIDDAVLRQFATYVGEGYQVRDDLDDWDEETEGNLSLGQDVLSGRPTVLRAFAIGAGGGERLSEILSNDGMAPSAMLEQVKRVYTDLGAFEKAEVLYARLRQRALDMAGTIGDESLQRLLRFLVRNVLKKRTAAPAGSDG